MTATAATGTVYALIDPRDNVTRYIGATKQRLTARLKGHLGTPSSPAMRSWIAELRALGMVPLIEPVREHVPAGDLNAAEEEEITRVLAVGGTLLNAVKAGKGREMDRQRREAQAEAAEREGWRELAALAVSLLGGPLPPGRAPVVPLPDVMWELIASCRAAMSMQLSAMEKAEAYGWCETAVKHLKSTANSLWTSAWWANRDFESFAESAAHTAAGLKRADRAATGRMFGLAAWYGIAVYPWRHLAELAGLPTDDLSFTAWAGRDPETREALEFLASCDGEALLHLWRAADHRRDEWSNGPGHMLGAVAVAYAGTEPPGPLRSKITEVLEKLARDRTLTPPMAAMLMRLNPNGLDDVLGPDVAAEIDRDLGLEAGTAGKVARALAYRFSPEPRGLLLADPRDPLQKVAARSTGAFLTVALPDFAGWTGPSVLQARAVSASLVRAGLASPAEGTGDAYIADVTSLWASSEQGMDRVNERNREFEERVCRLSAVGLGADAL